MRFATLFRAANRYFFENRGGLDSPQLATVLEMSYKHTAGTSINLGNLPYSLAFISQIKIFGKYENSNFLQTEAVFSTTIHEIAHSSHWKKVGAWAFSVSGTAIIRESWANAVEWWITRLEYYELGVNFSDYEDKFFPHSNECFKDWDQSWPDDNGSQPDKYTPVFIDLVDDFNQSREGSITNHIPTDECPGPSVWDNANCYVGTPPAGTTAFIYEDHFYYTPLANCGCPYPGSWCDGAHCFLQDIPDDQYGFIYNNNWYLSSVGDPDYPYDQITGYSMAYLEDFILPNIYTLSSLETMLKLNLAASLTQKHITIYFQYYYNYL